MRILCAPDSFKGSLSAHQAAARMAAAVRRAGGEPIEMPVADGGEGTVAAVAACLPVTLHTLRVSGPYGEPVEATYAITGDGTAVIEMAEAAGLTLSPRREPAVATSYGVGELITAALDRGCRRMVIGIGGSATNDGGAGAMAALGARFLDDGGRVLPPGGGALARLAALDMAAFDTRVSQMAITVACDVTNPLTGPGGATAVYGPQKGATPEGVRALDAALSHYAQICAATLGVDRENAPGAGAAGGLGYALQAFCGASFASGIDTVLDLCGFEEALSEADLVLTGEGRIDGQSLAGKVLYGIGRRARARGVPVVALGGAILPGAEALYDHGITAMLAIPNGPMPLGAAMQNASALIEQAAENAVRLFLAGGGARP